MTGDDTTLEPLHPTLSIKGTSNQTIKLLGQPERLSYNVRTFSDVEDFLSFRPSRLPSNAATSSVVSCSIPGNSSGVSGTKLRPLALCPAWLLHELRAEGPNAMRYKYGGLRRRWFLNGRSRPDSCSKERCSEVRS